MIENRSSQDAILDFLAEHPKPDLNFKKSFTGDEIKDKIRAREAALMERLDAIRTASPLVFLDSEKTVRLRLRHSDLSRRRFVGEPGLEEEIEASEISLGELDRRYDEGGDRREWKSIYITAILEMIELNGISIDQ